MSDPSKQESVIVLHGLGRSKFSMALLAAKLRKEFHVVNKNYPSRRHTIEDLATLSIEPALDLCKDAKKIHFVTHSLGGILVRQYLRNHQLHKLGNTVMLGPPNKGSELVDFFQASPYLKGLFEQINGPAGQQLGTQASSMPNSLGPVDFPLGVIAGNKNRNPVFNALLPKPSDGKVSVESTKLAGMHEHLELAVDHTWMMNHPSVIKATMAFLKYGTFTPTSQTKD